ncbi:succinate-semialdehyde dehydrogenase / glutarate-semialdehyde dehydrogenase [Saccharopolyspora antimicrobica]|uniref:Succinate-semialdehyde dehydrogenase / glutarate-semialdehyde dehydrogenase n=1 Tax=Saccharopolyspora antimicrobica TaxID=455193 RepID=A0A1I5LY32_9PSEU|nr:aldehyde dehydrogenase family protein [Saccharopolyspora antimicrobica]RKT89043.1 succinate-semialdehyde dehydrogenase/glutarate-semialdehyde dehydrogenase [Saccharopolyspora antimicrobica]SFP01671.1 succinate-semialdehyde dehydrogenase / glutarate-semialdehyde dehydrogenase [Saccharopolyspora antimicrobica]
MPQNQVITCRNFHSGTWHDATGGTIERRNPATAELVAVAPRSSAAEVDAAVASAAAAFRTWRKTLPADRARYLHELAAACTPRIDDMAAAITREQGKPLDEARGEVRKFITALHYYAEEAQRVFGRTIPNDVAGFTSIVEKEPVGPVAGIVPWNYPIELIGWKLAGATAAGCTIVIKPSELTPGCAQILSECIADVLPAGVVNFVHGDGSTGRALVEHPAIAKVAFTGSMRTGQAIFRSVNGITGLSLELGGSCPMIVTARSDVAAAVKGAARRSFRNAGQICIAINRIYVQEPVYHEFVSGLAAAADALEVADGLDFPAADVGSLTMDETYCRTLEHIADARERGASVVAGGGPVEELAPGLFLRPTVVADAPDEALVMHEETFGPLVGVAKFSDLDDAIARANAAPGGLAAYAYTDDTRETFTLARELDFGNVAVNNVDAGIMNAPYGGRRESGFGSEHGHEGLESYLQLKHIRLRHGAQ